MKTGKTLNPSRTSGMLRELLWLEQQRQRCSDATCRRVFSMKINWLGALHEDMVRQPPAIHSWRAR